MDHVALEVDSLLDQLTSNSVCSRSLAPSQERHLVKGVMKCSGSSSVQQAMSKIFIKYVVGMFECEGALPASSH